MTGRLLHPEIRDDGDAEEKGDAFLNSDGWHETPPEIWREPWSEQFRRVSGLSVMVSMSSACDMIPTRGPTLSIDHELNVAPLMTRSLENA